MHTNKKKKFVGPETEKSALNIFGKLVEEQWHVLYSMWSPSTWISSGEFIPVGFPQGSSLSEGVPIYKIWSSRLKQTHYYLYLLVNNVGMSSTIYDYILSRVWNQSRTNDSAELRFNYTCEWLKTFPSIWTKWLPSIENYLQNCNDISDSSLQSVIYYETDEDWKNNFDVTKTTFPDLSTAQWARTNCLLGSATVLNTGKMLGVQAIAGIVLVLLCVQLAMLVYLRHTLVMAECAWKLCAVYIIGGLITVANTFLSLRPTLSMCYIQVFLRHGSLVLTFGILFGKTWRLWNVFNSALHLKDFHMTGIFTYLLYIRIYIYIYVY
ncbi:hypothetical protein RFI_15618, partial [Reticulomyxa filosa]